MNLAQHRLLAGSILVCAGLGVGAVGRTMVRDSPAVAEVRHQLDGRWVATRVRSTPTSVAEGADAAASTVEFAGHAVRFTGLVEGGDSAGTYIVEPRTAPRGVDFKMNAGWFRGSYRQEGDRLTLCLNQVRPLERLGVPSRGYPRDFEPGQGRFVYEFRRADR